MILDSGITREALWEYHLNRHPSAGFDGTTSAQRENFIADALELLRNVHSQPERDLISDIVTAVGLNGRWLQGEPTHTFQALVESVINTEDRAESNWRRTVTILQAMLLEFADRIEAGNKQFSKDADALVKTILDSITKDVENEVQSLPTSLAFRLALMLAANFSVIHSNQQRADFIDLLVQLVDKPCDYNHPFLIDLVFIYDQMDLRNLDNLWDRASVSRQ